MHYLPPTALTWRASWMATVVGPNGVDYLELLGIPPVKRIWQK
jgi:hypothetical protein